MPDLIDDTKSVHEMKSEVSRGMLRDWNSFQALDTYRTDFQSSLGLTVQILASFSVKLLSTPGRTLTISRERRYDLPKPTWELPLTYQNAARG
jgi:hypothetical protein